MDNYRDVEKILLTRFTKETIHIYKDVLDLVSRDPMKIGYIFGVAATTTDLNIDENLLEIDSIIIDKIDRDFTNESIRLDKDVEILDHKLDLFKLYLTFDNLIHPDDLVSEIINNSLNSDSEYEPKDKLIELFRVVNPELSESFLNEIISNVEDSFVMDIKNRALKRLDAVDTITEDMEIEIDATLETVEKFLNMITPNVTIGTILTDCGSFSYIYNNRNKVVSKLLFLLKEYLDSEWPDEEKMLETTILTYMIVNTLSDNPLFNSVNTFAGFIDMVLPAEIRLLAHRKLNEISNAYKKYDLENLIKTLGEENGLTYNLLEKSDRG